MEEVKILTKEEILENLKEVSGWEFGDDKIYKTLEFSDFTESVSFIDGLVDFCNSIDHHPDIHVFYNKIKFELHRFDIGGKVTNRDFVVAKEIDRLYSEKNS